MWKADKSKGSVGGTGTGEERWKLDDMLALPSFWDSSFFFCDSNVPFLFSNKLEHSCNISEKTRGFCL